MTAIIMNAILKLRHQIENLTPSIDTDLPRGETCQISTRSYLKRRSLGFLKRLLEQKEQQEQPDVTKRPTTSLFDSPLIVRLRFAYRQDRRRGLK